MADFNFIMTNRIEYGQGERHMCSTSVYCKYKYVS